MNTLEQTTDEDAEPALNLIQPRGMLGDIDKANAVGGVTQKGSTRGHRLENARLAFFAQIQV